MTANAYARPEVRWPHVRLAAVGAALVAADRRRADPASGLRRLGAHAHLRRHRRGRPAGLADGQRRSAGRACRDPRRRGGDAAGAAVRRALPVDRHLPLRLGRARPGRRHQSLSIRAECTRGRQPARRGDLPQHQSRRLCGDHLPADGAGDFPRGDAVRRKRRGHEARPDRVRGRRSWPRCWRSSNARAARRRALRPTPGTRCRSGRSPAAATSTPPCARC